MNNPVSLADWILQAVTSSGTGALTLGAAESGHIRFGDRFTDDYPIQNVPYTVVFQVGDDKRRETGLGTLTSATSLNRTTILATLANGVLDRTSPTPLDIQAGAVVYCSLSEETYNQHWAETVDNRNNITKLRQMAFFESRAGGAD